MTLVELTPVLGWALAINLIILVVATLSILLMQGFATSLHGRLFGLDAVDARRVYFRWLGNYKLLTLVFFLAPYLALRLA